MIVSMHNIVKYIVFGHYLRSSKVIRGQISIELELYHACAQIIGGKSWISFMIVAVRNNAKEIVFGY